MALHFLTSVSIPSHGECVEKASCLNGGKRTKINAESDRAALEIKSIVLMDGGYIGYDGE